MNKWENYGDENPVEHGGFWVKKERDIEDCYYVITLAYYPDNENFILTDMYIDISSYWIDWKKISDYLGIPIEKLEIKDKIIGAISYYDYLNFEGDVLSFKSEEEVLKKLLEYSIKI